MGSSCRGTRCGVATRLRTVRRVFAPAGRGPVPCVSFCVFFGAAVARLTFCSSSALLDKYRRFLFSCFPRRSNENGAGELCSALLCSVMVATPYAAAARAAQGGCSRERRRRCMACVPCRGQTATAPTRPRLGDERIRSKTSYRRRCGAAMLLLSRAAAGAKAMTRKRPGTCAVKQRPPPRRPPRDGATLHPRRNPKPPTTPARAAAGQRLPRRPWRAAPRTRCPPRPPPPPRHGASAGARHGPPPPSPGGGTLRSRSVAASSWSVTTRSHLPVAFHADAPP